MYGSYHPISVVIADGSDREDLDVVVGGPYVSLVISSLRKKVDSLVSEACLRPKWVSSSYLNVLVRMGVSWAQLQLQAISC